MKKIKLTRGKFAWVDDKDFERMNQFKWAAMPRKDGMDYYAYRVTGWNETKRTIYFHVFLTGCKKPLQVDHVNGSGLDNRRSNLRICTRSQNGMNRAPRRLHLKKYKSPFKGITFDKSCGRWIAQLRLNGKTKYLGRHETAELAAKAYDVGAIILFGKFARTNQAMGCLEGAW